MNEPTFTVTVPSGRRYTLKRAGRELLARAFRKGASPAEPLRLLCELAVAPRLTMRQAEANNGCEWILALPEGDAHTLELAIGGGRWYRESE